MQATLGLMRAMAAIAAEEAEINQRLLRLMRPAQRLPVFAVTRALLSVIDALPSRAHRVRAVAFVLEVYPHVWNADAETTPNAEYGDPPSRVETDTARTRLEAQRDRFHTLYHELEECRGHLPPLTEIAERVWSFIEGEEHGTARMFILATILQHRYAFGPPSALPALAFDTPNDKRVRAALWRNRAALDRCTRVLRESGERVRTVIGRAEAILVITAEIPDAYDRAAVLGWFMVQIEDRAQRAAPNPLDELLAYHLDGGDDASDLN